MNKNENIQASVIHYNFESTDMSEINVNSALFDGNYCEDVMGMPNEVM